MIYRSLSFASVDLSRAKDDRALLKIAVGSVDSAEPRDHEWPDPVIRVDMGFKHVGDAHRLVGCELNVRIDICLVRINDAAYALAPAAEDVRGASGVEPIEWSKDWDLVNMYSIERLTLAGMTFCGRVSARKTTADTTELADLDLLSRCPGSRA